MADSSARTPPAPIKVRDPVLGGLSATAFLRRYWQKEALVIRGALDGFRGPFTARDLFALARRDDVESRLVVRAGARWSLRHGPFRRADFAALPKRDWTLLVQGVNLVSPDGDALLRRFAFLPYARLDDLMVSYAAPGGGVGAHFDSYDVFLLQGFGRRRWRFGRQGDLSLKPRMPLKILKRFEPEQSETLSPGDMLYLPPQYAHDGVAIDACTTYSIGFRAASANELAAGFLDFLRDGLDLPGRYTDPDLAPVRHPAEIGVAMQRRFERMLRDLAWDRSTIARFIGCWLSEPKPHVAFDPPERPMAYGAFNARAARSGVSLDTRTQLLYDATHFFINGTCLPWSAGGAQLLKTLANARALAPCAGGSVHRNASTTLYQWYRDGYLHTGTR
ncbi:MAG: cupin domain-containing protein [Betaproteobacteria bacterium]